MQEETSSEAQSAGVGEDQEEDRLIISQGLDDVSTLRSLVL